MWSARHRKAVLLAWVLIVIVALGACTVIEANTDIDDPAPGETGEAIRLLDERFGGGGEDSTQETLVFSHPSLTVDDQAYRDTVRDLVDDLSSLVVEETSVAGGTTVVTDRRVVADVTTHYDIGVPREFSPLVAQNETGGDTTFALVMLVGDDDEASENIDSVLETVASANEASSGFNISIGGAASFNKQITDIVDEDFGRALFLNLPITFAILILAFGAVIAALVPLALAIVAVVVASGILAIVSQSYALSMEYSEIVLLMGLATGIDYSLFVISRYRTERRSGRSKEEALRTASGTSGKAVVFAGTVVLLAISGMFVVDNVVFSSLGLAAIVAVAVAIILSVSLLPALVALLGDNLDRLSVPFFGRGGGTGAGIWGYITDQVLARPAILATVTVVALMVIGAPSVSVLRIPAPYLPFNLGFNGVKSFPDDAEAKEAVLALQENFTIGLISPENVIVDAGEKANVFAQDVQSSINQLVSLVEEESVTRGPANPYGVLAQEPEINSSGDTEIIFIPINADSGEEKAIDAVNHLRKDLIPTSFEESTARALVAGQASGNIDFRDKIYSRTPFVFAFVLGLAFIILLLMFRSIVIPIKAIILNLLSVGAAYGVLVLVFQEGWPPGIENLLGFEATGIVESWLPLFLFAILFGLSMDYHMFVLGRIKEAYEKGASNEDAVSIGIKATAGTITSAAAIMVAVFSIFAFMRLLGMKQFGVGLGVAILIDATVIRSILLPASMKLLGDLNWYLPSWLEWLPKIKMEEGSGGPLEVERPAG
jgi:RND superfamily putative drug exporter